MGTFRNFNFVLIYIDDFFIMPEDEEQHKKHLQIIFVFGQPVVLFLSMNAERLSAQNRFQYSIRCGSDILSFIK